MKPRTHLPGQTPDATACGLRTDVFREYATTQNGPTCGRCRRIAARKAGGEAWEQYRRDREGHSR